MTTQVITLTPENTLGEARAILLQKRIHHLPVLDGRKLVGLITSWDIFKLGKSESDYTNIRVGDVMTRRLATLEPSDKIGSVAEVLMEHLFHAIPIVNAQNELEGIVTSYDLLRYEFKKEYPANLEKFVVENM